MIDAGPVPFRQAAASVQNKADRQTEEDVRAGMTSGPENIGIRVRGDAEGSDAPHPPRAFDQLHQADAARHRGIRQGAGLDLSIVAVINVRLAPQQHGATRRPRA